MCVVSFVHEEYGKYPLENWTKLTLNTIKQDGPLELFEQIVALSKRLDAALGLPDCESAHKTEWLENIRKAVREHAQKEIEQRLKVK